VPGEVPEGDSSRRTPSPALVAAAPKAWGGRDLLLFIGAVALALVVANVAVLAGYAAVQSVIGWPTRPAALRENAFLLLALQLAFHGLVLGCIYLLVVVNYRQPFWAALRWGKPTAHGVFRFLLGGVLLSLFVQLAPPVLPDREDFPLLRLFSSPEAAYALTAFAVLIAPFMEELIFRGVLFRFFENLVGVRFAVAGTAILFAGLHVPEYWGAWNHVLLILLVGVAFSLARGLTGSLTPSVVLHVAYNAGLMVAFFFETNQFRALGGCLAS
jgi:membrane protease YdiL (CAAX protease family)